MITLTVGEFKRKFSYLLQRVREGEKVEILYGKQKEPVAMLVPLQRSDSFRKIGLLDGKAAFTESGDGKITEEEFFGIE